MCASEAQIAANRRNAKRSTGPETPEGKERSRANALKHGLCLSTVVAEDLELIQQRADQWYYTLKPQNEHHSWLVDKIAIYSVRIDRAERMERRTRDVKSLKALLTWGDDRRIAASKLGGMISKRPDEVGEELRRTSQGCDWMISRWRMLADAAGIDGGWTSEQTRLAFDLLGTPEEFRQGRKPGVLFDLDGQLIDPADDQAAVARRELAALQERREVVADLDDVDRALTEADLTDEADPELRRLRRYESSLRNKLRWCLAQFRYESPHHRPHPDLKPRWVPLPGPLAEPEAGPESEAAPEPVAVKKEEPFGFWRSVPPNPPFDLEPDEYPEPGQEADIPAILASRREKKAKKAEARRESRRRKLEKLRA